MVRHRLKLPRLVVVSVVGLLTLTVCAAPPTRGTLGASQVQPTITSVIGSGPTVTSVQPIAFKETPVQRIRLLQTAPIYGGPNRQYLTIGAAAKDAELQVTGTSVDGLWWRISCDGRGQLRNQLDCWVEADPTLTAVVTEDKGAVVAATEATATTGAADGATAEVVTATASTDTPAPAATETAQVVASTDTPAPVVAASATPAATVAETSTAQVAAIAATDTVVAPTAKATLAATEVATIEPTTAPSAASTATAEASPVPATATEAATATKAAATATVEAATATAEPTAAPTDAPTAKPTAAPTTAPTTAPTKVPTPLPSPTIAAPTATPATQAAAIKRTTVQYIITQAEVKVLDAPETGAELGTYPAGTKIEVTGYTSADGMWWRVTCLDGTAGACFVSADPSLTAPAVAPK